ncbi:MAG TPA: MotA/TolQ/ExbB proton channel family protein [Paludibacteraceae bacterium]|nr:MotA/TolQ/ExbB proton channel family protein [Paludibacteraceae bacterium]HPB84607.1 MotA/TolQ/ExbB proton channel family protein [Paludibacteraceae bacterium]HPO47370.1 MotA/TolQ/ExbB proton channel family protein [Paludibacteraceae bacterium]
MIVLQNVAFLADSTAAAVPVALPVAETEVSLSFFDMAIKGGVIMIPIVLLLLIAVYIFIERVVVIRKASKEDASFMNRIKDYIYDGKLDAALNLCKDTRSPSARMIEKGISRLGRPMSDVLVAIENVGNFEIAKLEKGLGFLATIAGGAPMLGFLGTVVGMVEAFFKMEQAGGNTVDLSTLAGGIYTAMVTTVAGLIVGICAYFAYNYLVGRIDRVMRNLEIKNMEFLDLLNEPAAVKK